MPKVHIYICRGMSLKRLKYYCKNANLTENEFEILKDYYVKRIPRLSLSFKYNYSESMIDKIKAKAIDKIFLSFDNINNK